MAKNKTEINPPPNLIFLLQKIKSQLEAINRNYYPDKPLCRTAPPENLSNLKFGNTDLLSSNNIALPNTALPNTIEYTPINESLYPQHTLQAMYNLVVDSLSLMETANPFSFIKNILSNKDLITNVKLLDDNNSYSPLIIDKVTYEIGTVYKEFINSLLNAKDNQLIGMGLALVVSPFSAEARQQLSEIYELLNNRLIIYEVHNVEHVNLLKKQKEMFNAFMTKSEEIIAKIDEIYDPYDHKTPLITFLRKVNDTEFQDMKSIPQLENQALAIQTKIDEFAPTFQELTTLSESVSDDAMSSTFIQNLLGSHKSDGFWETWSNLYQESEIVLIKEEYKSKTINRYTRDKKRYLELIEQFEELNKIIKSKKTQAQAYIALQDLKDPSLPDDPEIITNEDDLNSTLNELKNYQTHLEASILGLEHSIDSISPLENEPSIEGVFTPKWTSYQQALTTQQGKLTQLLIKISSIESLIIKKSVEKRNQHLNDLQQQVQTSVENLHKLEELEDYIHTGYFQEKKYYEEGITRVEIDYQENSARLKTNIEELKAKIANFPAQLGEIQNDADYAQLKILHQQIKDSNLLTVDKMELIRLLNAEDTLKNLINSIYETASNRSNYFGLNYTNVREYLKVLNPFASSDATRLLTTIDQCIQLYDFKQHLQSQETELAVLTKDNTEHLTHYQTLDEEFINHKNLATLNFQFGQLELTAANMLFQLYRTDYTLIELTEKLDALNKKLTNFKGSQEQKNAIREEIAIITPQFDDLAKDFQQIDTQVFFSAFDNNVLPEELKQKKDALQKNIDEYNLKAMQVMESWKSFSVDFSKNRILSQLPMNYWKMHLDIINKIPRDSLTTYLKITASHPETIQQLSHNFEFLCTYLREKRDNPDVFETLPKEFLQSYLLMKTKYFKSNELLQTLRNSVTDNLTPEEISNYITQLTENNFMIDIDRNQQFPDSIITAQQELSHLSDDYTDFINTLNNKLPEQVSLNNANNQQNYLQVKAVDKAKMLNEKSAPILDESKAAIARANLMEKFFGNAEVKGLKKANLGIFGNYLKERAKTYWLKDFFENLIILGCCINVKSDATNRRDYLIELKETVKKGNFSDIQQKIKEGSKTFPPRSGDFQSSLQSKLEALANDVNQIYALHDQAKDEDDFENRKSL